MESESAAGPRNPGVDDSAADRGACAPLAGESRPAAVVAGDGVPVKRKRGRPARAKTEDAPVAKKSKNEDEDVCFICFDGGDLVLCDRRNCPKAYHPTCIKRDESYFSAQAHWDCGWHQCNGCEKNALFKCYTCPYSLCKACVRGAKGADISCVRGNKGFCKVCRDTILLIENVTQGSNEVARVDFDDKGSWEYLFKVYWIYTKQKESLTLDELSRATNPWKSPPVNHRVNPSLTTATPSSQNVSAKAVPGRVNPSTDYHSTCVNKPSETSSKTGQIPVNNQVETNVSKRRKTRKQQPPLHNSSPAKVATGELQDSKSDWVSEELLDFIAHIQNGDTPVLSQFDVQGLLLEYITRNNLRDPLKRCEIICDTRLEILFGKTRVGHFEMLQLIEYLCKDESSPSGAAHAVASDISGSQVEKKKQAHKKPDVGGRQDNLDSYAAIDFHNMNLVYLRRSLVESLLEDAKKFHEKVVGAIVRIRIPGNDPKQEMYRLVRVVGAGKAAETYKVGERETDIKLKILNLNKIEDILIDSISNQDFSKDECRRLRQSIKCGLVDRMTVGEVQEKAMVLQEVRIKDVLESEISKLNHLRDRASEMGHRKQLRECVEKLEVLKSPEERERRIRNIPEVHVDPRMDPKYQSDEDSEPSDDEKELDQNKRLKYPRSGSNREVKRNASTISNQGKEDDVTRCHESSQTTLELETDAARILEELRNQGNPGRMNADHEPVKSISDPKVTDDASVASSSSGLAYASESFELERIWLYEDPSGKVQGPFCMLQLRKWNSNNYFPSGFRIWRTDQSKENSVLLTDLISMDEHEVRSEHGAQPNINLNTPWRDNKLVEECNPDLTDAAVKNHGQESLSSGSRLAPSENQISSCVSDACPSSKNLPSPTPESEPGSEGSKSQPSVEKLERNLDVGAAENEHPVTSESGLASEKMLDTNLNAETEENQPNPASERIVETEENQHPVTSERDPGCEESKQQASEMVLEGNLNVETKETQNPVIIMDLNAAACQTDFPEIQPQDVSVVEPTFQVPQTNQSGQDSGSIWNPNSNEIDGGMKNLNNDHCVDPNVTCQDLGIGGSWNAGCSMVDDGSAPWALGSGDADDLSWLDGPIELNTLGDESVSDLLCEVEALENIRGLLSPELDEDFGDTLDLPIEDCYRLVGLSPPFEPEKHEPWTAVDPPVPEFQIDTPELLASASKRADCSSSPDELNPPAQTGPNSPPGPTRLSRQSGPAEEDQTGFSGGHSGQWDGQPPVEVGGGYAGPPAVPPRGRRTCKFFESGGV